MDYVLIQQKKSQIQAVLLVGSKDKLEKARQAILDRNSKRNYSVDYKLTIWKVKGKV